MQNISVKPNFNMNDIQNKNILMPNFNYNYNFNLGQMKPIDDPTKIDLYNNSLMIFDQLQNAYPNNSLSASEIYNTYNYSLKNLRENSKNLKLEDITKRTHFYFYLYNLINKKKCQKLDNEEYKCSFINTNMPFQPNNKKIQININNNLFNRAMMNNGIYAYNNKNGLLNNSMSTSSGSNMNNNFIFSFENNNNKNQFLEKKRNLDNTSSNENSILNNNNMNQSGTKKKKKKNKNKNKNKKNAGKNGKNVVQEKQQEIICNNNNNNNAQDKNIKKKKESPMIQIENNDLKNKKLKQINRPNTNFNNNNETIEELSNTNLFEENIEEKKEIKLFQKDLKDYLKRTMSDTRKIEFFKNIVPESLNFMKNLFNKGNNNIQMNRDYPIYRNNLMEISLMIEHGGKIKIKSQLK